MKKKNKKIISVLIIVLIVGVFIGPIFAFAEENESISEKYVNGDLRCNPSTTSSKCKKTTDSLGRQQVIITENNGDFTIKKYVTKVGTKEFSVKIEVEGRDNNPPPPTEYPTPYVGIILDNSSTIGSRFNGELVPVLESLYNELSTQDTKYVIYKFTNRSFNMTNCSNFCTSTSIVNYDSSQKSCSGSCSDLYKSIEDVTNEFNSSNYQNDTNPKKAYLVILGDGVYGDIGDEVNAMSNFLSTAGEDTYVIGVGFDKISETKYYDKFEKIISNDGNNNNYTYIDGTDDVVGAFEEAIQEIVNQNSGTIGETTKGTLIDNAGKDFKVSSNNTKNCHFNKKVQVCDNITFTQRGSRYVSDEFKITLKDADLLDGVAAGGWYKTNNGFYFSFGSDRIIDSKLSAEVYWREPEGPPSKLDDFKCKEINKANGLTLVSRSGIDDAPYWKYTCKLQEATDTTPTVRLTFDNIEIKKIEDYNPVDATHGIGVNLQINAKIECVSELNEKKKNNDKEALENDLVYIQEKIKDVEYDYSNVTKTLRQNISNIEKLWKNSKEALGNVIKNYENYHNILKNEARTTVDNVKFPNITVKFGNSKDIDLVSKQNEDGTLVSTGTKNCSIGADNQGTCIFTVSKEMTMPETCIVVQTGETLVGDECNLSINKEKVINGIYKYYPSLNDGTNKKNKIEITLYNFLGSGTNITIGPSEGATENSACIYKTTKLPSDSKLVYREVSVADPFNLSLNPSRGVGTNWDNSKVNLNFQNAIDSGTWSNSSLYQFPLSKVNASEINADTNSISNGISKYSGTSCEIDKNENGDYAVSCPLVREYASNN